MRRHAVDNTVVVTFGNMRQAHLTENWVYHLRRVGVRGMLVGMMNMRASSPQYVRLAAYLRDLGVGVYTVNSPEVHRQPQGGRWFHVLPLLRTGARVLLSDSDVVWLRDPRPYLKRLEALHPKLDFTVSSDAQGGTDHRRLEDPSARNGHRRRRYARRGLADGQGGGVVEEKGSASTAAASIGATQEEDVSNDLDVEDFGHCWTSMNIGIMHFPPGVRPGTLAAMEQAVIHLSSENNLGRVDQGPINYRWKHGAGKWRWKQQLYGVKDRSGRRLCGLLNATSVGAVLPAAQFCNTLTHSVLQLWRAEEPPVRPYALHATWMRQQREEYKLMRLREEGFWRDPPTWYGRQRGTGGSEGADGGVGMGPSRPRAGFITYQPKLGAELLKVVPMVDGKGGIPLHHLVLMHEQLKQFRNALFIARALDRALILPYTVCTCEMGFFPFHLQENCRAHDHPTLRLPYNCSIDHYLDPVSLDKSPYAHRERSFLSNPRTPEALHTSAQVMVRVGRRGDADPGSGAVLLDSAPTIGTLRAQLSAHSARLLVFDDMRQAFGGWGPDASTEEIVRYHEDAQSLLSNWCCTADKRFKRLAGVIPYVLPPLPGQQAWRGRDHLRWGIEALTEVFDTANEKARADEIRLP